MSNHPQKRDMPTYLAQVFVEQCPDCPPGNSLPVMYGAATCDLHGWWHYSENYQSALINLPPEDDEVFDGDW